MASELYTFDQSFFSDPFSSFDDHSEIFPIFDDSDLNIITNNDNNLNSITTNDNNVSINTTATAAINQVVTSPDDEAITLEQIAKVLLPASPTNDNLFAGNNQGKEFMVSFGGGDAFTVEGPPENAGRMMQRSYSSNCFDSLFAGNNQGEEFMVPFGGGDAFTVEGPPENAGRMMQRSYSSNYFDSLFAGNNHGEEFMVPFGGGDAFTVAGPPENAGRMMQRSYSSNCFDNLFSGNNQGGQFMVPFGGGDAFTVEGPPENAGRMMQRSYSSNCFDVKQAGMFYGLEFEEFLDQSSNFQSQAVNLNPIQTNFSSATQIRRVCSTGDLQMRTEQNRAILPSSPEGIKEPYFKMRRYTPAKRKEKVNKFRVKRNQRNFNKTVKYAFRKTLAEKRLRIRGRFARNDEVAETPRASSSQI